MSVELPAHVLFFDDEVFSDVVDYLRESGEIDEDEVVVAADIHVEVDRLVEVDNIETRIKNEP